MLVVKFDFGSDRRRFEICHACVNSLTSIRTTTERRAGEATAQARGIRRSTGVVRHRRAARAYLCAYAFRCAFTGAALLDAARIDPAGNLLRLGPGDLTFANAMPACDDAIFAYERGHLAIGTRREFIVALDVIAPELVERLNPIGRLAAPDSGPAPDPWLFKSHRDALAAGLIDPR